MVEEEESGNQSEGEEGSFVVEWIKVSCPMQIRSARVRIRWDVAVIVATTSYRATNILKVRGGRHSAGEKF